DGVADRLREGGVGGHAAHPVRSDAAWARAYEPGGPGWNIAIRHIVAAGTSCPSLPRAGRAPGQRLAHPAGRLLDQPAQLARMGMPEPGDPCCPDRTPDRISAATLPGRGPARRSDRN